MMVKPMKTLELHYPMMQVLIWATTGMKTEYLPFRQNVCVRRAVAKKVNNTDDEDGIRTHACKAHWISSPTP